MNQNASPDLVRTRLFRVYAGLLALLALTALAARLPLSRWSLPVALAIATAKLALILLYFMRLRAAEGMVRIFAVAGFLWLTLAAALLFSDYLAR